MDDDDFSWSGDLDQHVTESKPQPFEAIWQRGSRQTGGVVWPHKLPELASVDSFGSPSYL